MSISLIIPCYNEVANIQKGVLDKIGNYTNNNPRFQEVIIVDDGSTDESRNIINDRYLSQFPKFRLVENKHQGKAFAIIRGIKEAQGDFVMFSDIDLATPIEESDKLIEQAFNGAAIIIGSRAGRAGAPFLRKLMSGGSVIIKSMIIGLRGIKDTQCGFKIFEKKAALRIIDNLQVFHQARSAQGSSVSAGFDLEFLFVGQKLKYKIKEVPVIWRHVETKNVNFIKDSYESLKDILLIKYYDFTGKYAF